MPRTNFLSSITCNECEIRILIIPDTRLLSTSRITSTSKVHTDAICVLSWSRYYRTSARSRSGSGIGWHHLILYGSSRARSYWACNTYTRSATSSTLVRQDVLLLVTHHLKGLTYAPSIDLKLGNIMMVPPGDPSSFLTMTIPKLQEAETSVVTGPGSIAIPRVHSRPLPYPLPDHYDMYSFDAWSGVRVKIGDVGVGTFQPDSHSRSGVTERVVALPACWADRAADHSADLIQAPSVRAPEVAVGAGWGKPADIWSLGCMVSGVVMNALYLD